MTAVDNSYKGRIPGARNKRTVALLSLAEAGETPCAFALRIMRDEGQDALLRMQAAKLAAAYVHPRPHPELPTAEIELPENLDHTDALREAHEAVMRAVASGELEVPLGKDLSAILETHRRIVETVDLESRIAALEAAKK